MNTANSAFPCPYCGHEIQPEPDQAGQEARCPSCDQSWSIPAAETAPVVPAAKAVAPENIATHFSARFAVVGISTVAGTTGWWVVFGETPLILIGTMLGFLVGRTIVGIALPVASERESPAWFPGAHWSLLLSVGAWLAVIAGGVFVVSLGWLRGEGASMLLMFIVMPALVVLGLIGGPTATSAARKALNAIHAGQRPSGEKPLAQLALFLSGLMTIALLGFLLWMLALVWR
jgi:hypothetical protein